MPALVILGANGFIGRAILSAPPPVPLTAIARTAPPEVGRTVRWVALDLLTPGALAREVAAGDVVINLAYLADADPAGNLELINSVIAACVTAGAARLVHCSTAVVAGRVAVSEVDETTPCVPFTPYERTKLALEACVLRAGQQGLDVAILRPTAVVGPGGQNLLKLARAIESGNSVVNYLRACLYGRRPMHLVSGRDVAAAAIHLALLPGPLAGGIYIVAADESADNEFRQVEALLRAALGVGPRRVPLLPVPSVLLSMLLRRLGRSDTDLGRRYDATKLRASGCQPVQTVRDAVLDFGKSLRG